MMNPLKPIVFLVFLAASASSPFAAAQDAGFYVGGSLGRSNLSNDTAALTTLGAAVISTDEKNTAWKGFGGYQINKYFGVEASYVGLGTVNATGTFLAAPFVTSARVNGLALAAVGTFPINPRFDVFAKLGGFYSKVKSTATVAAIAAASEDNEVDWTAGIGASFNVNKKIAIRAEIERYELGGNGNANLYSVGAQFKF